MPVAPLFPDRAFECAVTVVALLYRESSDDAWERVKRTGAEPRRVGLRALRGLLKPFGIKQYYRPIEPPRLTDWLQDKRTTSWVVCCQRPWDEFTHCMLIHKAGIWDNHSWYRGNYNDTGRAVVRRAWQIGEG